MDKPWADLTEQEIQAVEEQADLYYMALPFDSVAYSPYDFCANCSASSDERDFVCIGCPNNPHPYEDHFVTHQL